MRPGDAKDKRIADLETRLADATTSAHDWHLKAKELETQLQAAKANEEWARSIVAHSVTRSAPRAHPNGLGVRAVGVRAVSPPPQHAACPQSRNDYPHPTPPLQLYAESWCTARCTSWVCKCTMCSLGL